MTRFSAASRSSLLTIAKLFLVGLHGFRSKIPHFAMKAIFEMGSNRGYQRLGFESRKMPLGSERLRN